jgi:hypothetical protein
VVSFAEHITVSPRTFGPHDDKHKYDTKFEFESNSLSVATQGKKSKHNSKKFKVTVKQQPLFEKVVTVTTMLFHPRKEDF